MALRRAITGRFVNPSMAAGARSMSTWWRNMDSASKDSNIGVAGSVLADPSPNILNAGIGKETERTIAGNLNKGCPSAVRNMNMVMIDDILKHAFRETSNFQGKKINEAMQGLSRTGMCRPMPDFQNVVRGNEKQALYRKSRLQQVVRPMYSNPTIHGAPMGSSLVHSVSLANIRMTHSKASFSTSNGSFSAKTTLRPLSPHLTVYKPQSSSTTSIFHRIAYIYMAVVALFYYLLYVKMGMICFTYEKFYQFFYYISDLFPIINEISVVALAYYLYKGAETFMKYR